MESVAAVLDVMTAAATSLDFFDAVAISLVFFFNLGFLVFFGRALLSVVTTLPCAIVILVRGGAMKLSARRTASLRPSGGGSRTNGAETLGDAILGNSDEFGRAAWRSGKAGLQTSCGFKGALGCTHLVDSFCIGRVVNVACR